jgi:hypothetical protein
MPGTVRQPLQAAVSLLEATRHSLGRVAHHTRQVDSTCLPSGLAFVHRLNERNC